MPPSRRITEIIDEPWLDEQMKTSGMLIHPLVFFSMMTFYFFIL